MIISEYINRLNSRYQTGQTTEHSFRGDLQSLLQGILPRIRIINEPQRQACGAPDYILMHQSENIPIGYIEAKDIGINLKDKRHQEQFSRYKDALQNLVITDYLTFEFYFEGNLTNTLKLGEIQNGNVIANPVDFEQFILLMHDFSQKLTQTITNPANLAIMMANKAKMLANIIENALKNDLSNGDTTSDLMSIFETFKTHLIHDLDFKNFADVYSQTIAYGMFAARYHDKSLGDFSRAEAAKLIPHSNPFLRKLFGHIAGIDLDDRITWVVEELVKIFQVTNVKTIMASFGKSTRMQDPIIHFYETFLAEFDPKLRKSRGVWYTPKPVVSFIVRAVDHILKLKFNITDGLADTNKIKINKIVEGTAISKGKNKGQAVFDEKEIHRIQILDPGTGTGTFLNEVVRHVFDSQGFSAMGGMWNTYVENELIPRLNGFELLMASYAMAHLKMDMLLNELADQTNTPYTPTNQNQRFRIFLTNSLEEHHKDTGTLFANWLSTEANEANRIKRDTPVMVILGNPPYSGESANKGSWIMELMEDYKKEPGSTEKLNERNPKWINDDYVKFLRYGQHFIERNKEGVLAFINPHGFLDNPTFRGMRWNLLKTYDQIYIIDLHGNSKKKEKSPNGSADINVFDIQQGVSINIFVKTGKKKEDALAEVFHFDLYGSRDAKYDFLNANELEQIKFVKVENIAPNYFFVPKNFELKKIYDLGFSINQLFPITSVGIVTAKDAVLINENENTLLENVEKNYGIKADTNFVKPIQYRPFDRRFVYFDVNKIERAREKVMRNFIGHENFGLVFRRQQPESMDLYVFFSNNIIADGYIRSDNKGGESIAPLYCYPENSFNTSRVANLDQFIVSEIEKNMGLTFTPEKDQKNLSSFTPLDLMDYVYAVLHSSNYREKFKEFLKIDYPRVPYPKSKEKFFKLIELGTRLRQNHSLESINLNTATYSYPIAGNNKITNSMNTTNFELTDEKDQNGRVWINEEQYFDKIPKLAWEFYIGGYQPAQKWLKDRKNRALTMSDVKHYFSIISSLSMTKDLMNEIDNYV